jgi:suppressor of ftsI
MARQAGFLRCAVTLLTLAGIAASPTLADTCPEPALIDDLPDPPELAAADGELRGTLAVAPAEITVRGCPVVSNVINGDYMAPTLRIRRGDTIRIRVVNQSGPAEVNIDGPQPTNIHYHGMDVAPSRRPPGDNVFIRIGPDRRLRYDVFVPDDHPQGLHWYHAHVHHFVDDQIGSGVSGMLIVDGFIEKHYPELADLRRRVMVFKDFTFPSFMDGDARAKSLNGFADPPIRARPGEYQVWQLGNLGADAFFDMRLAGHRVWLIERDGNLLLEPVRVEHVFLPPGARSVVVVQAGAAGTYAYRHRNVDTGPAGDPNPAQRLGRFIVSGEPVADDRAIRERLRNGPANPTRSSPTRERSPSSRSTGPGSSTSRRAPTATPSSSTTRPTASAGSTRPRG